MMFYCFDYFELANDNSVLTLHSGQLYHDELCSVFVKVYMEVKC